MNVLTPCPLPRRGPAILVCNHISGLDPLLLQSVIPRLVTWMMAKEYYDQHLIGWVFKAVQAIPVERSGRDLAATRASLRALANGHIVGIFPEGKIETEEKLFPFQTGVALIAIKTHAPVFPVYLEGTQRGMEMIPAFTTSNRIAMAFGPAVEFDRRSTTRPALQSATETIHQSVKTLRRFTLSTMGQPVDLARSPTGQSIVGP